MSRRAEGPHSDGERWPFWSADAAEVLRRLHTTVDGLTEREAASRGPKTGLRRPRSQRSSLHLLARQFTSPLVLLLVGAATVSAALRDLADAAIILGIVAASGLLSFWQERGAADTMRRLLALVRVRTTVRRDGRDVELAEEEVVPGDVLVLDAGSIVPADARVIEARDCFADEAPLTGETFPVEKQPEPAPRDAPLARRSCALFAGTHVVSGTVRAVVVHTGGETELGLLTARAGARTPATEFEHSLRRFGTMMLELTLVLVLVIFAVNVVLHKPPLDSFMFSVALAVGLTPQLLPAIVSVNLARGARRLARGRVIVKRLSSIESFGSMDVLCSDKTGTLTEGCVRLAGALDPSGAPSDEVARLAWINAAFESGFRNPIDEAIRAGRSGKPPGVEKLDEAPYDFVRKRLSVAVLDRGRGPLVVTKGAFASVLEVCTRVRWRGGELAPIDAHRDRLQRWFERASDEGLRVLAIATRTIQSSELPLTAARETQMILEGVLTFEDPPRAHIAEVVARLRGLGVGLKMITGDNARVARAVAGAVGLSAEGVITGPELHTTSDEALVRRAASTDVFAEIEPNQKERILHALRKSGHVVGYLGDGINDAPALHLADVGIAVDSGADVAKQSADFVLLEHDLSVLVGGVEEGRRTFANTLKYVYLATSANFGNMISMAGASLLLPFLPLLPSQVLLVNLLTDLPEMTIAGDRVDPEMRAQPHRLELRSIRRFMVVFGLASTVFDFVTFAVLVAVARASPAMFRTGWFVESVLSASIVVLVLRTRHLARSRPATALVLAIAGVAAVVVALPYTPLAGPLGFVPLPLPLLGVVAAIVASYVLVTAIVKRAFDRRALPRVASRAPERAAPRIGGLGAGRPAH